MSECAVYQAIAAITGELAKVGIAKGRRNTQQGYQFRGIDDVYSSLSSLLASHSLCVIPRVTSRTVSERETKSGGVLFYAIVDVEFDLVSAKDGSKHTARIVGEAMDSGDKATNKAMSAAYKYFALQTFCIPTEGDNDADAQTHEVKHTTRPDKLNTDPNKVDSFVKEFRAAFDLDVEDDDKARAVFNVHTRISSDHDNYIAVGEALTPKERNAIQTYVALHKNALKNQPMLANGRAAG